MGKVETSLARAFFYAGDYVAAEATDDLDPVSAVLLKACVCSENGRYAESLKVLRGMDVDEAPARLRARFYGQRALVNKKLGNTDSALIDYEAARYWAVESGDQIVEASALNNLSKVYSESGRLAEALDLIDRAIRTVEDLNAQAWLGRFLDQKAQILFEHDRAAEAVEVGRKAVEILEQHGNEVSLSEARTTYGKALVTYGASQLDQLEPITKYTERKKVNLAVSLDAEIVQLALDRTGGRVYQAAKLIKENHPALIKAIARLKLDRQPKRRRAKSLIKK